MKLQMMPLLALAVICAGVCAAQGQQPQQVVLTIMTPEINNLAPGIDAAVAVTPEQANALAAAYREVFQASAVTLANSVLQDPNARPAQRELALATLQQAQGLLQSKARTVLTMQQRTLVDKVQAAYTRVVQAAQQQMVAAVKANFTAELDTLLTPEQKAAMLKARAEIAARKPAPAQPAPATATPAPAGTK